MKKDLDTLDKRISIVRHFIEQFYNKTLFTDGKSVQADLSSSVIKALFAFTDPEHAYRVGELQKQAGVKRSTITDIIDRLERDGIAERISDTNDRRVIRVRLTKRGRELKTAFLRHRRSEFRYLFSRLQEEETDRLLFHLDEACRILNKIN
jgi:DNA-binding MarR family transcriptional regulator